MRPMRKADHPVSLSRNLGTLTSWNPRGHSRPVTGLLYLFIFYLHLPFRNLISTLWFLHFLFFLSQVSFFHRSVETAFPTLDNINRTTECFAYITTCFPSTHCTNQKFIDRFDLGEKVKCTLVQALRLCTGRTVNCTLVQALRLCTGRTVKFTLVQALRLCTGCTVKFTLVQALRLCTGRTVKCTVVQAPRLWTSRTAHTGSRGIALPFHDHGTRRGWGVSVTLRPLFTPGKNRYPLYRRLGEPQGRYGKVR
jgi:hypothetical protein